MSDLIKDYHTIRIPRNEEREVIASFNRRGKILMKFKEENPTLEVIEHRLIVEPSGPMHPEGLAMFILTRAKTEADIYLECLEFWIEGL